jgi:tetratricopeptide (TPR) repeat protein
MLGNYKLAKDDAEAATTVDPQYAKAWSRLALVEHKLGNHSASVTAYRTAIETGGTDLARKGYWQAKFALNSSTVNHDLDETTALVDLIICTPPADHSKYRTEGRRIAAEYAADVEYLFNESESKNVDVNSLNPIWSALTVVTYTNYLLLAY